MFSIDDLAIFGGQPKFQEKLHVGRPNIGNRKRLIERINDMLDRRWLTNDGPYVQELEQKLAAYLGVKHVIAMCNATVALEITIRAVGMKGEVIVPSLTFVATAHALQWQEITPVFCDVNPETHNIDPERVEALITPNTTGIIGVHLWGRPCEVERLAEIARRRNLHLLFDAAHAFACSHQGHFIGRFGEAEVLSFHATKFFNTLEGGAVVTNDDELARKIRLMKNFGFEGYDKVSYIGTNGKMDEMSAAMGLTSLESLEEFVRVNKCNYDQYRAAMATMPGVKQVIYDERERCNYQYIVAEIDEDETGITRDQIVDILWAENVMARRYFYPACHRMEPYRSYFPHAGLLLPHTIRLSNQLMSFPNGTAVGHTEIERILQVMRFIFENAAEIRARLENQITPMPMLMPQLEVHPEEQVSMTH